MPVTTHGARQAHLDKDHGSLKMLGRLVFLGGFYLLLNFKYDHEPMEIPRSQLLQAAEDLAGS